VSGKIFQTWGSNKLGLLSVSKVHPAAAACPNRPAALRRADLGGGQGAAGPGSNLLEAWTGSGGCTRLEAALRA
jgi:hypothetical protein